MKKKQIFLIHFAGGNCYSFQFMMPYLKDVEVIAVELPGRGKRAKEELLHDFDAAALDLFAQILPRLSGADFIIYGHSMGSLLGLRIAAMLEACGKYPAGALFTGNAGPGIKKYNQTYLLDRPAFKEVLRKLGGIPEEVFQHEELFSFVEPIIRADFEIVEKSEQYCFLPVKTPIYTIMGTREEFVGDIDNWRSYTHAHFTKDVLFGGHFFIHDHVAKVCQELRKQFR